MVLRYFIEEEILEFGKITYKATCRVRNEINSKRKKSQVVKTYPKGDERLPYMPRRFPTGVWEVFKPIWTNDIEFWPVKIPTNAVRRVLAWYTEKGEYSESSEIIQDDAYYHLHFSRDSISTLGCIRLNSANDAEQIARRIEGLQAAGHQVLLEVVENRRY
ncbi:MAG: hypothetical protein PQJ58_17230 [Spirochaetales bacterium]|nr:hypothetical protein [Spirochaetales bacterium]